MSDEPTWKKVAKALGLNPIRIEWKLRAWKRDWVRWLGSMKNRSQAITYAHQTCPRCSHPAGSDERTCTRCGEPLGGAVAQKAGRVLSSLWPAERPMVATLLGAAIIATYAATVLASRATGTGSAILGPSSAIFARYGELDAQAISSAEWQRLVTSAYLHVGLIHLGFNLTSLWTVATFLEEQLGRAKTFALYTLLAITGGLGSYAHYELMSHGVGTSVGASGAVCGLIGVALGYSLRRRNVARHHTGRYALWAIWILVIAFSGWRIDNYGHAGGFIPGFLLGLLIRRTSDTGATSRTLWKIAAAVSFLVTVAAFIAQARLSS